MSLTTPFTHNYELSIIKKMGNLIKLKIYCFLWIKVGYNVKNAVFFAKVKWEIVQIWALMVTVVLMVFMLIHMQALQCADVCYLLYIMS